MPKELYWKKCKGVASVDPIVNNAFFLVVLRPNSQTLPLGSA